MNQKQLHELLDMAISLAKPTSPAELLQCIHIDSGFVTATGGDCVLRIDARDADVLHGVRGCVNARRLSLALNTMDTGADLSVRQSEDGQTLTLRSRGGRRAIPMLPAEYYPLPAEDEVDLAPVAAPATLAGAIAFLRPAVATNIAARPAFTGVNSVDGAMGASDGARAHFVSAAAAAANVEEGTILPLVGLDKLQRLASDAVGDAARSLMTGRARMRERSSHAFVAQWHRYRLRFPLIAAQCVPLGRVVPAEHADARWSMPRQVLRTACRGMVQLAGGKSAPAVTVKVEPGTLSMELVGGLQVGERVTEHLDIDYSGAPLAFGVNPDYVADALEVLDGDTVTMSVDTSKKHAPLLFTGAAADRRCVVMPMRV